MRRRVPTCVLTHGGPPALADGHAVDRYVEIGSLTKVVHRLDADPDGTDRMGLTVLERSRTATRDT
ncbi:MULTISPECIES: hypothetical protein [Streptomyces]|uniref:hypothetical protein n=1 Tax=Streptomyces TaxID=1883 RepID=UPI0011531CCD|nr:MULTISPECIES: hypothetical protein [Streptomyces]TQJ52718.1 hypothetical protein FBY34_0419 [Streptomyces sp. SLBN-115]